MADINLGVGGANSATGGYEIDNSYKNENDNGEKMTHTYDSAPTSQQKGTISIWYKRTEINTNIGIFQFGDDASGDYLAVRWGSEANGSLETYRSRIGGTSVTIGDANGAVRDTSAWYHMVIAIDTTQATATNRFRVYRNGEELAFSTDNRSSITQNANMAIGENGKDILIGEGVYKFNGYIAEVNYIDGQQLSSTDFGEYDEDSGIWIPKKYTGSYGNNGFYLDFKNASNLGEDQSGNNHDFTLNNITSANQATDTPTNNFATWNVLDITRTNTQGVDILEGAMSIKHRSNNGWTGTCSNIAISKGKWYWEAEVRVTNGASMWGAYPVATRQASVFFDSYIGGGEADGYDSGAAFYDNDDAYYHDNTATVCTISGSTFNTQTGDVIMIAVDMDNNKLYAGVNGNWCNSSDNTLPNATGITLSDEPHFLAAATYVANTTNSYNFGGFTTDTISSPASDANGYGTFEYAPPSGYYALCTKNLAEFG